ncbi:MAG TPA: T9SS type A sorting domain-containing protein [Saprospiraceae bacterium]|nr:T9SS type A sorting domain-containing protein [Saprospiraceae bacterium]HMU02348.1 T9SS type A sorting domain-containing protein [Saprospiraceae bacterium]
MKYILLLILKLITFTLSAQCPESIILCSQEDVDAFRTNYPSCTNIYSLEIDDKCKPIFNLDSLYEIERVNILRILPIDSLKSLNGLKNLNYVQLLSFYPRKMFAPFPSLDTIVNISHHFLNPDFDLSVYQDVKQIKESIRINSNGKFNGLGDFSVSPKFSIIINNCSAESNIACLLPSNQIFIDFFLLLNCSNLNLDGMESLEKINRIAIQNSANMNCSPLAGIDTVKVFDLFNIDLQNILLDSLHLLANLEGLFLTEVDNLYNIEQILPNLNSISWAFGFNQNKDLINIDLLDKFPVPLSQLSTITWTSTSMADGRISITNNPSLESCNLELICKALEVYPDSVFISNNAGDCDKEKLLTQCISSTEDELWHEKVQIVPNPSSNFISIITELDVKHISIYDINGKIVGTYYNHEQIDVTDILAGIYFISFEFDNGKRILKKFVKL